MLQRTLSKSHFFAAVFVFIVETVNLSMFVRHKVCEFREPQAFKESTQKLRHLR